MIRITIILLFSTLLSTAQTNFKDSLKRLLGNERVDSSRIFLIAKLSNIYRSEKPITGLSYAQQGIILSKKINFLKGEAICLNALGDNYRRIGEFTKGLQAQFDALKIFEQLNDVEGITISYHGISVNYEDREDYPAALTYAYKVLPTADYLKNTDELMRIQSNMGRIYEKLEQLDSALHYEQNAYEIAISKKDSSILGNILSRLGNIYLKLSNPDMAYTYYKMGIPIAIANNDNNSLTELFYDMATLFQRQSKFDSAIHYAKMDLQIATGMSYSDGIIKASSLLTAIYNNINIDSAYKYLSLSTTTKDSLFTNEKLKQIQLLAFEEEKRQKEIADEKLKVEEERQLNIQYALIALGIIIFVTLFLLLSRTIVANEKLISFFAVLGLLVVFEFINLLIHPWLAHFTHESPILMLLTLVLIAALLIPLHHRLEHWIKDKMVEKNKKIRLAAAKKTIAKLENNSKKNIEDNNE